MEKIKQLPTEIFLLVRDCGGCSVVEEPLVEGISAIIVEMPSNNCCFAICPVEVGVQDCFYSLETLTYKEILDFLMKIPLVAWAKEYKEKSTQFILY